MSEIEFKAAKIVANSQIITLASIDENGYPRPVPMVKLRVVGKEIYFATGNSSAKTSHFKANPKSGISIIDGKNSIIYTGEVQVITDIDVKVSLWSDWMYDHFAGGIEDPEYCILMFSAKSATYWIDNEFVRL